jgi:hypothetical protein
VSEESRIVALEGRVPFVLVYVYVRMQKHIKTVSTSRPPAYRAKSSLRGEEDEVSLVV